jgi:hypothetical protein
MASWTDEEHEPHLFIPLARETVQLLEQGADPLRCVEAVTRMRGWVDDVLEEYVREARRAGHGWDAVARALGVTRQAAWQRFRSTDDTSKAATSGDILRSDQIWSILVRHMIADRWYELGELYALVEANAVITAADCEPDAPRSTSPRWQRNVRNVLQRRKTMGDLEWDGRGRYRLSS